VQVAYPIPKFLNLRAIEAALNIVQKFWKKSRELSMDPSVFSTPRRFRFTTFDFFRPTLIQSPWGRAGQSGVLAIGERFPSQSEIRGRAEEGGGARR